VNKTFIELAWESHLHREAYIAILKSAMNTPGSKRLFAQQVGITPEYLSYLLNPEDHRTPGLKIAEKIAAASPLDPEQRESLLTHLCLASQRRVQEATSLQAELPDRPIAEYVEMLGQAHHLASITTDPLLSKRQYLAVRDASANLLKHLSLQAAPLAVVQICLILHDTQCLLNRPDDALYHAKLASLLTANIDSSAYPGQHAYLDHLEFEARRAQAVAYHNMRLPKEAYACCEAAEATRAMREQPEVCKPHLYRDKLNIVSRLPRFTLSEADGLAHQVRHICNHRADTLDPVWDFLIQRSLGRAYIAYGNLHRARRILGGLLSQLHHIPQLGLLHQTLFLNTYAKLLWKLGEHDEWQQTARHAFGLAASAGLIHQFNEMRQDYGPLIVPFLEAWNLMPTGE
jgi:hypothetical protein